VSEVEGFNVALDVANSVAKLLDRPVVNELTGKQLPRN
jgi:hypothetical protein